ncbi:MAG TPA: hypothetical protein VKQ36_13320 [Ktedonobacterales bacterium]|nr:hypothetical protein [Ktedonobacterales bacterium]
METWEMSRGLMGQLRRRGGWALTLALCLAGLSVLLIACGSGPSGGTPSGSNATDTPFGGGALTPNGNATYTPPAGFPTATPTQSGSGGTRGSSDICEITPTPSPSDTPLPGDVPAYPNAQLIVHTKVQSNTNPPTTIGEFDFCANNASADTVVSYYTNQLPKDGWQNMQTYTSGSVSILANKGPSSNQTSITVTILQDLNPGFTNDVEIVIAVNNLQ